MPAAPTSDQAVDPLLGEHLGPYRIERQLGEGGMCIVYKAVHGTLGQVVAIKVLRRNFSGDNKVLQRFFNESVRGTAASQNRRPKDGGEATGNRRGRPRGATAAVIKPRHGIYSGSRGS